MLQQMPSLDDLTTLVQRLSGEESATSDAERVDLLSAMEATKAALAAAQARITVSFAASQRAEQSAQGVPAKRQGVGIAGQIALARRESRNKGNYLLGLALALQEMPNTYEALATGTISEWRASIVVRETATLSAEHRAEVDARLAGRLADLGDRGVARAAKELAYALDPGAALKRSRKATADRRVTIRPAPDTMANVTGLLPAAQGVAVYAALRNHAATLKAGGDPRTRGQIMADTFVQRVTGQASAPDVPAEIQLVMTDTALLGDDHTPARIVGYGPVPASVARSLIAGAEGALQRARAWVRRLYTDPTTGQLVAMDARRRAFDGELRDFLVIRDEVCRTPWCDAPIRAADHAKRAADGGTTSADNGQGLCEACNLTKEAPGWVTTVETRAGPRHTVTIQTPTGHRYTSTAPDPPGTLRSA